MLQMSPSGLSREASPSHVYLFTTDTHQFRLNPGVSVGRELLLPCRNPKILGITLDPSMTFKPHLKDLAKRARSRLNIMRALAGVR